MLEAGGGGFSVDVFKVVEKDNLVSKDVFCWRRVVMEVFSGCFLRLSRRITWCQRMFFVGGGW